MNNAFFKYVVGLVNITLQLYQSSDYSIRFSSSVDQEEPTRFQGSTTKKLSRAIAHYTGRQSGGVLVDPSIGRDQSIKSYRTLRLMIERQSGGLPIDPRIGRVLHWTKINLCTKFEGSRNNLSRVIAHYTDGYRDSLADSLLTPVSINLCTKFEGSRNNLSRVIAHYTDGYRDSLADSLLTPVSEQSIKSYLTLRRRIERLADSLLTPVSVGFFIGPR
ncbi:hypothetical protein J6590_035783 [Homalodisca vitripennis]|nr:hypothetical protein J6590_035783 [Homalodisca vitripennis]